MSVDNKFLIEEVRDGFMVPGQIKQLWAAELVLLEEIDRVCNKYDIQYFADWGTLLGTVRHGGFIPWDDDLDIVMKREDYQKFRKAVKAEWKGDTQLQTYEDMEYGHWLFMGKVVSKEYPCFEADYMRKYYNFPYMVGIDIFVLDYVYSDTNKEERRRELCLYLLAFAEKIVEGSLDIRQIQKIVDIIWDKWKIKLEIINDAIEMGRYLYHVVEQKFAESVGCESQGICQLFPWGLKGTGKVYPVEYYNTCIRLPFEHTSIPVPLEFDKMLKERYGDYYRIVVDAGAHKYPCFEAQKRNFFSSIGLEDRKYCFNRSELDRRANLNINENDHFKDIVKECVNSVGIPKNIEEIIEFQQISIDLGKLIEEFNGEGFSSIKYIEEYCEKLYELYEYIQLSGEIGSLETVRVTYENFAQSIMDDILNRNTIVLMPTHEFGYASLRQVYKELVCEQNDVFFIPVGSYYKDYDGSLKESCGDNYISQIEGSIKRIPIEQLEFLFPEQIYITDGYDQWNANISVDPQFYSDNLLRCTKQLIYWNPYNMDDFTKDQYRAYHNTQYYVTCPGVVRADTIVVADKVLKETYIDRLTEFCLEDTGLYWREHVISYDEWKELYGIRDNASVNNANNSKNSKSLLYCVNLGTIITRGKELIDTIEKRLNIILQNKEIELCFCTFPSVNNDIKALNNSVIEEFEMMIQEKYVCYSTYEEIDVDRFEAYYGDVCHHMIKMNMDGKPVMVQNYDISIEG